MTQEYTEHNLFILTELNLPKLLWKILLGRNAYVLHIWPQLPGGGVFLGRICGWLRRKGRLGDAFQEFHGWDRFDIAQGGAAAYGSYTDSFLKSEPWLEKGFNFEALTANLPDYAMAIKHRVCARYFDWHWMFFALRTLPVDGSVVLHGSTKELEALYSTYNGVPIPIPVKRDPVPRQAINLLLCGANAFYIFFWMLLRIKLIKPTKKKVFLGVDLLALDRHLDLTKDMLPTLDQGLVVFRNEVIQEQLKDHIEGIPHCRQQDGVVPISAFLPMFGRAFRDLLRIHRLCHAMEPLLYLRVSRLAYWRVVFRALNTRFAFQNFVARDDYNAEHIIRTQELRKFGVKSLGIAHGLPTYSRVQPLWRYLSFDIYYTFGRYVFERYYRETLDPTMVIRGIGSIGLCRGQLTKLRQRKRPLHIASYVADDPEIDVFMEDLKRLALHFSDRKIFVKIKSSQFRHDCADPLLKSLSGAPKNLIDDRRNSYEIMLDVGYAVTITSTISAECIGYGLPTFVLDRYDEVFPDPMPLIYRDFDGICYTSVEAIIERIEAIEEGKWEYPFGAISPLTASNLKVNPFDVIREDLGLAPLGP